MFKRAFFTFGKRKETENAGKIKIKKNKKIVVNLPTTSGTNKGIKFIADIINIKSTKKCPFLGKALYINLRLFHITNIAKKM
jgi:hypothetical protein